MSRVVSVFWAVVATGCSSVQVAPTPTANAVDLRAESDIKIRIAPVDAADAKRRFALWSDVVDTGEAAYRLWDIEVEVGLLPLGSTLSFDGASMAEGCTTQTVAEADWDAQVVSRVLPLPPAGSLATPAGQAVAKAVRTGRGQLGRALAGACTEGELGAMGEGARCQHVLVGRLAERKACGGPSLILHFTYQFEAGQERRDFSVPMRGTVDQTVADLFSAGPVRLRALERTTRVTAN